MYDKNRFIKVNNKKLLHKIGKKWVVVSTALLCLLGLGEAINHTTVHADTNNGNSQLTQYNSSINRTVNVNQPNKSNKNNTNNYSINTSNINQTNSSTKSITNKAINFHNHLMSNVIYKDNINKLSQNKDSSKIDTNVQEQNNGNNTSIQDPLNNNQSKQKIMDSTQVGSNNNYFSGDYIRGNDAGLNYIAYSNGGVEFINGHITDRWFNSEPTDFGEDSYVSTAYAIKFDSDINISNVTNMNRMFSDYRNLQSIDLSNLDTSNVTDMAGMFSDDSNLRSINLSNRFNTFNVTDMAGMFRYNNNLQTLDLSNFDTSNVSDMGSMFYRDSNLQSIDLGNNFNTSNVNDMNSVFCSDTYLQSIDLGDNFDTSKVTDMGGMFSSDTHLQSISLGDKFDTSNVTDMYGMFSNDSNLQSIDLSNFNTSNVTDMEDMFSGDTHLRSIDLSNFNTSNVTSMYEMFSGDSNLQSIDLGDNFDTSEVTDMGNMFRSDSSLRSIDLGDNFDTSKVTDMWAMFHRDSDLRSIDLGDNFNTSNVTEMENMFSSDNHLRSIDLGDNFDTSKVSDVWDMFSSDSRLDTLIITSNYTKFIFNCGLPLMYKELTDNDGHVEIDPANHKPYTIGSHKDTISDANDFNQGNIGIFTINKNPKSVVDTFNFEHGNNIIKSIQLEGQSGIDINVKGYVPDGYNVNTSTKFTFNGGIHTILLGVSRPNNNGIITPKQIPVYPNNNQIIPMKTDTFNFLHGNNVIKSIQLEGLSNSNIDVKSYVPTQYNVNSGTVFTFDSGTHVIQLGISRPNGNDDMIKPKENNVRPNGNVIIPVDQDVIDTINFIHGNKLIKTETKQGQQNTFFDIKNDVPSQYNEHSNTQFTFDGQTHNVRLGIIRPNNNKIITPKQIPIYPNDNQIIPMKTDNFNFKHGDNLIKTIQLEGHNNDIIDVKSYVPSQYNKYSNTQFKFDGGTHVIQLGVSRPNGNDNSIRPKENNFRPNGNIIIPTEHDVIDTINFDHGNNIIKKETKKGQQGTFFNVKNDVPSGYNVDSNTEFIFDGKIHTVQLGINNSNNHGDNIPNKPDDPIIPPNIPSNHNGNNKPSFQQANDNITYQLADGTFVSSATVTGQLGTSAKNAIDDAGPAGYSIISGDNVSFDNKPHTVNVTKPLINKINGVRKINHKNISSRIKHDVFNFETPKHHLIKRFGISGQQGTRINVSNAVPNKYKAISNTNFIFDGKTHEVYIRPDVVIHHDNYSSIKKSIIHSKVASHTNERSNQGRLAQTNEVNSHSSIISVILAFMATLIMGIGKAIDMHNHN